MPGSGNSWSKSFTIAIVLLSLCLFADGATTVWEDVRHGQEEARIFSTPCHLPEPAGITVVHPRRLTCPRIGGPRIGDSRISDPRRGNIRSSANRLAETMTEPHLLHQVVNILLFRRRPDQTKVYLNPDDPKFHGGYPTHLQLGLVAPPGRQVLPFTTHRAELSTAEKRHCRFASLWVDNGSSEAVVLALDWSYLSGSSNGYRCRLPAGTLQEFRLPQGTIELRFSRARDAADGSTTSPFGSSELSTSNHVAFKVSPPTDNRPTAHHYQGYLLDLTGRERYRLTSL